MLTKMVNGIEVECSAQEEAEIRAEWASEKPAQEVDEMITASKLKAALEAAGVSPQSVASAINTVKGKQ